MDEHWPTKKQRMEDLHGSTRNLERLQIAETSDFLYSRDEVESNSFFARIWLSLLVPLISSDRVATVRPLLDTPIHISRLQVPMVAFLEGSAPIGNASFALITGEVSRGLTLPQGELLTSRDLLYLKRAFVGQLGQVMSHPLFNQRPGVPNEFSQIKSVGFALPLFPMSSKPFRYAKLALAASKTNFTDTNKDALGYLAKFCMYIKEAMETSSILEVIMASYIALLNEFMQADPQLIPLLILFKGLLW